MSIPLNFQLLTTGMTALNHGLTLKMELDFPYSTLLEMFGGFWVRMWWWWVQRLWKRAFSVRNFQPCDLLFDFSLAGRGYPCSADICWSHLSVSHALHFCQVWWSPGDGLPQRGHRWHHSSVWPHHVSAYPQGGSLLCLLQQVGCKTIRNILYDKKGFERFFFILFVTIW